VNLKLLAWIKAIISKGGNVNKATLGSLEIIDYCTKLSFKEEIKIFQYNERKKERGDKKVIFLNY